MTSSRDEAAPDVLKEAQELTGRLAELSDDLVEFALALAEFNRAQQTPGEAEQ